MRKLPLLLVVLGSLAVAMTVHSATTGNIKVTSPGVILDLKTGTTPTPVPFGREVPVPPDTYTPADIICMNQDKAGLWQIKSTGPFGKVQQIQVTEGQTTEVEAGPPFLIKATVSTAQTTAQGKVVTIGLVITGKAGESYSPASITKNKGSVPPPQFRIVSENGQVVGQGYFGYG